MNTPHALKDDANKALRTAFGVAPERSTLVLHDTASWEQLKRERKTEERHGKNVIGLYTIADARAHVWMDHPGWETTLLHEYHGHGLYYERSRIAQIPMSLRCHISHHASAGLPRWGFRGSFKDNSEGFAVWMESYLCRVIGQPVLWQLSRRCLTKEYLEAFEHVHDLEQNLSEYGVLRQMGIPIRITPEGLTAIVRASAKGRRTDLVSYLPTAQVEDPLQVLIVSDERPPMHSTAWFAPRVIPTEQFIAETKRKDSALAREITQGSFLYGDEHAWVVAKGRLSSS